MSSYNQAQQAAKIGKKAAPKKEPVKYERNMPTGRGKVSAAQRTKMGKDTKPISKKEPAPTSTPVTRNSASTTSSGRKKAPNYSTSPAKSETRVIPKGGAKGPKTTMKGGPGVVHKKKAAVKPKSTAPAKKKAAPKKKDGLKAWAAKEREGVRKQRNRAAGKKVAAKQMRGSTTTKKSKGRRMSAVDKAKGHFA